VADLLLQVFTKDNNGVEGFLIISPFHLISNHRLSELRQVHSHQPCSQHTKNPLPLLPHWHGFVAGDMGTSPYSDGSRV